MHKQKTVHWHERAQVDNRLRGSAQLWTAMYNSWGIGNDLSGGSASILNAQPTIVYTINDGWTYNLSSQINGTSLAVSSRSDLYDFSDPFERKRMGRIFRFDDEYSPLVKRLFLQYI
jgi:hypothetical protein